MWNINTSIDDPEIVEIKETIIKKGLADESVFKIQKNFDVGSGATHYPVIFLVDISSSLSKERETINNAIQNFIRDILGSQTPLSSSVDFAIVTFSSKVQIKRPFSYITKSDLLDGAKNCSIAEGELGGMTYMGSGMFAAWYIAEARKLMYKEAGIDYKQPVFVLISDLGSNEQTMVGEDYLVSKVISLFNEKYEGHKLGLLKALFGSVSKGYDEKIKGMVIDAPAGFADMLNRLFAMLVSTIAVPDDFDNHLSSDEDDGVFWVYGNQPPKSKKIKELQDLFRHNAE